MTDKFKNNEKPLIPDRENSSIAISYETSPATICNRETLSFAGIAGLILSATRDTDFEQPVSELTLGVVNALETKMLLYKKLDN